MIAEGEWYETAGIMVPRLHGLAQALVHNLPEPDMPVFVRQHVAQSRSRVGFYSDGSCQCPEQMPFTTAASSENLAGQPTFGFRLEQCHSPYSSSVDLTMPR